MKKFLSSFLIALVLLAGISKFALAEETNVNLTVKNNGDIVYSGSVVLLPAGTISISDSSGNPHDTNADSVLSIVNTADASSEEFNISNLIYYDMFGAFYLKCISVSGSDLCDNWQYKVDDASPEVGMDSKILSGGENVVLYFGDENPEPEPEPEPEPTPEPEPETPPVQSGGSSSGSRSGGYLVPNTVCEEGEKFSVTTGQPCTSFIPAPSPVPLPVYLQPTLLSSNISPAEKIKPVLPPTPKKLTKNTKQELENLANQNTATVINAVPETLKKNWFVRLLESIFSIF